MVNCNIGGGNLGVGQTAGKTLKWLTSKPRIWLRWVFSQPNASCVCSTGPAQRRTWAGELRWPGTQQLALPALTNLSNVSLIFFHSTGNKTLWKGKLVLWSGFSTRAQWHFLAAEQPVIKYQGINGLAGSMSCGLRPLQLPDWCSFSSQVPEMHSLAPQDKSAGQNQQGAAACSLYFLRAGSVLPKYVLPLHFLQSLQQCSVPAPANW